MDDNSMFQKKKKGILGLAQYLSSDRRKRQLLWGMVDKLLLNIYLTSKTKLVSLPFIQIKDTRFLLYIYMTYYFFSNIGYWLNDFCNESRPVSKH
jgi:hypothetical protein